MRFMRHGLWATLLALSVLAGCATLDEQQRKWVFQPSKRTWWGGTPRPRACRTSGSSSSRARAGEPVRLHGLWLPQPRADAPVLLYLHGARWDVRGSAFRMRRMHELGFAVLGIDYRGFGQSTDTLPSETHGLRRRTRRLGLAGARSTPRPPRYVFGHSLGGAIAVQLASEVDDESGVLVEGSFTSLPDVVSSFKWGWLPVGPLITQRFDAGARVGAGRFAVAGGAWRAGQPDPAATGPRALRAAPASPNASCSSKAARTTTPTRWASRSTARRCASCSACGGSAAGTRRRPAPTRGVVQSGTMSDRPTLKLKPGAAARNPQRLRVRATTAPRKAGSGPRRHGARRARDRPPAPRKEHAKRARTRAEPHAPSAQGRRRPAADAAAPPPPTTALAPRRRSDDRGPRSAPEAAHGRAAMPAPPRPATPAAAPASAQPARRPASSRAAPKASACRRR